MMSLGVRVTPPSGEERLEVSHRNAEYKDSIFLKRKLYSWPEKLSLVCEHP